jgi:hypothetical protein
VSVSSIVSGLGADSGLGTVVVLVNYRGKRWEKGGEKREKRGKARGGRVRTVLAFPLQIECTPNYFAATYYVTDVTSAILTEVLHIQHQAKLRYYFVQR